MNSFINFFQWEFPGKENDPRNGDNEYKPPAVIFFFRVEIINNIKLLT